MNLKPYIIVAFDKEMGTTYEVRLDAYDDCGGETYLTLAVINTMEDLVHFLNYLSGGSSNE